MIFCLNLLKNNSYKIYYFVYQKFQVVFFYFFIFEIYKDCFNIFTIYYIFWYLYFSGRKNWEFIWSKIIYRILKFKSEYEQFGKEWVSFSIFKNIFSYIFIYLSLKKQTVNEWSFITFYINKYFKFARINK